MNDNVIKHYRIIKNLTMEELGSKIGYTKSAIYRMEKGLFQPKASAIIKLSEILQCPIIELINHFAKLEVNN